MLAKLTRIMLAFVTALAFSAQLQSASAHCAQLAMAVEAESAPAAEPETPDCHGMAEAAPMEHPAPHHPAPPAPDHQQPIDHCECLAALKVFVDLPRAQASQHIEPYAWARPDAAIFASVEPAPALKPPRA